MKKQNRAYFFAIATSFLLLLTGCEPLELQSENDPPEMLSSQMFEFDATLFETNQSAGKAPSKLNFVNGVLRVLAVNVVVGAGLTASAISIESVHGTTPVFENGVWVWEGSDVVLGTPFTSRMEADISGAQIKWTMSITGGSLTDFTLWTAEANRDTKSGSFEVFAEVDGSSSKLMRGEFRIEDENNGELRFIGTQGAGNADGDSVTYTTEDDMTSMQWQENSQGRTHIVEWNRKTNEGSVQAPNYRGGTLSCWDANLDNTDCPV